jgi:hypothetical protein
VPADRITILADAFKKALEHAEPMK